MAPLGTPRRRRIDRERLFGAGRSMACVACARRVGGGAGAARQARAPRLGGDPSRTVECRAERVWWGGRGGGVYRIGAACGVTAGCRAAIAERKRVFGGCAALAVGGVGVGGRRTAGGARGGAGSRGGCVGAPCPAGAAVVGVGKVGDLGLGGPSGPTRGVSGPRSA